MPLADYRDCSQPAGINIVRKTVENPNAGGEFLKNAALREELAKWPNDELLSNEIMCELIPHETNYVSVS